MASQTQWTWVCWLREWWWIGRSGVLRFMVSQRVEHNWVTELNWSFTLLRCSLNPLCFSNIRMVSSLSEVYWYFSWYSWFQLLLHPAHHFAWCTPMRISGSFEKTIILGKIEGGRRRGQQRMRLLDGTTNSMDMSLHKSRSWWWWTGRPGVLQSMWSQRVGHHWATELNWTVHLR